MLHQDLSDGILTLRVDHGKAGALDVELAQAVIAALDQATAGARAVVLTGTGSIFSAGVDLFRLVEGGPDYVRRFFPLLTGFVQRLFTLPIPLVVAANGHSIAGGGLMVMAGDHRLVAEGNARIGVPELLVGVPFPAGPLELVRYAANPGLVQQLVFMGRTLTTAEALAHGLVDEVVAPDELLERAGEVARQLAAIPPDVYRLTKRRLRAEASRRMEDSAAHDESALAIWCAPETHARIREYLERTVRR